MKFLNDLLSNDETYLQDLKAMQELEKRYYQLPLTDEHRMIIGDYIACIITAYSRKCKIVYEIGKLLGNGEYL